MPNLDPWINQYEKNQQMTSATTATIDNFYSFSISSFACLFLMINFLNILIAFYNVFKNIIAFF
jgi:hypothetical protein